MGTQPHRSDIASCQQHKDKCVTMEVMALVNQEQTACKWIYYETAPLIAS